MPHRSLDQLSHDEKLAFINVTLEEQKQQDAEYLEKLKASWPAKAKPPEMKIKNSPAHAADDRHLLLAVLSGSSKTIWDDLTLKEMQAVSRCTWQLTSHPLHRRMIEDKGLDYVWAIVRQGPRLYGLD